MQLYLWKCNYIYCRNWVVCVKLYSCTTQWGFLLQKQNLHPWTPFFAMPAIRSLSNVYRWKKCYNCIAVLIPLLLAFRSCCWKSGIMNNTRIQPIMKSSVWGRRRRKKLILKLHLGLTRLGKFVNPDSIHLI